MPLLIPRSTESSHWYSRDGKPCHHVPFADKKRAGELRPTTLADGRKMSLLPSVTTVDKLIVNKALEAWKIENAILAALTLPRIEGETDDAFAVRVATDTQETASTAATFGTAIHDACEAYLMERVKTDLVTLAPYCGPVFDWIDENVEEVIGCEYVVVSNLGYAGRVDTKVMLRQGRTAYNDLAAENIGFNGIAIIDFKTRKPNNGKIRSYDSDSRQLSAYLNAEQDSPAGGLRPTATANLYISSVDPMTPVFKPWSSADMLDSWRIFKTTLELWTLINSYNPSF